MHWFRKTPWHVVSAGSIRRSQLAFSWSSAYLSRPCHASRCFINISKNRRRPVFFFFLVTEACEVVRENYKPNWMLYWCIDKGGVYRLAYSTIRFLFFSFSFSSWQLQRTGWEGALMNRRTPRRCWPAPTLPHVTFSSPLVPSPRSWRKERLGPRWEGGALGPENLLPVKKEGESQ